MGLCSAHGLRFISLSAIANAAQLNACQCPGGACSHTDARYARYARTACVRTGFRVPSSELQ